MEIMKYKLTQPIENERKREICALKKSANIEQIKKINPSEEYF